MAKNLQILSLLWAQWSHVGYSGVNKNQKIRAAYDSQKIFTDTSYSSGYISFLDKALIYMI